MGGSEKTWMRRKYKMSRESAKHKGNFLGHNANTQSTIQDLLPLSRRQAESVTPTSSPKH
jgi:hypothetical protein